jgi:hypothetical protein
MLSPKAIKRVRLSCGGPTTVTENAHEPVRLNASVATHSTLVVPIGNMLPGRGVHSTLTGDWPPSAVGVGQVTWIGTLSGETCDTGLGHATVGGLGVGVGVGVGTGVG